MKILVYCSERFTKKTRFWLIFTRNIDNIIIYYRKKLKKRQESKNKKVGFFKCHMVLKNVKEIIF